MLAYDPRQLVSSVVSK